MLKVLPSKFIPLINAGHEEYKSKGREGWKLSRMCGTLE